MTRLEQAQQDAAALIARLPRDLREHVALQAERLEAFLDELQDAVEEEGCLYWLEAESGSDPS